MRTSFVPTLNFVASLLVTLTMVAWGCARVGSLPPQATLAEIEPSGRAAKPPNCDMPVLRHEPLTDFRKVAIVEGLGNVFASESDVLATTQRTASESASAAHVIPAHR